MGEVKKFFKRYLIGFIIGLIVCGGVSVIAMTYFPSNQTTYDNSDSGMQATNVQSAIDELYMTCFPQKTGGEVILDKEPIVTSGDGLYEDKYESGKYTYKGANPNNYITFNNETAGWRIISINSDGTIKIMRDASIGKMAWDSSSSNNWTLPASLNTYLNSTYYNSLTSVAQGQVVAHDFSIGKVKHNDTNLSNTINNENATKWNGKVALATSSEYIRSNSNQSSCGTMNEVWNSTSCGSTTWMHNNTSWWTLTASSDYSYTVFGVEDGFFFDFDVYDNIEVRPTLYLISDVKIIGGDGTKNNPYVIE